MAFWMSIQNDQWFLKRLHLVRRYSKIILWDGTKIEIGFESKFLAFIENAPEHLLINTDRSHKYSAMHLICWMLNIFNKSASHTRETFSYGFALSTVIVMAIIWYLGQRIGKILNHICMESWKRRLIFFLKTLHAVLVRIPITKNQGIFKKTKFYQDVFHGFTHKYSPAFRCDELHCFKTLNSVFCKQFSSFVWNVKI